MLCNSLYFCFCFTLCNKQKLCQYFYRINNFSCNTVFSMMTRKKNSAKEPKSLFYKNNHINLYFFNDSFVSTTNFSTSTVFYNKLYNAHETEDFFYLFTEMDKGCIVPKNSFVLGTPEEMREFISAELGNKFIVNCK